MINIIILYCCTFTFGEFFNLPHVIVIAQLIYVKIFFK